MNIAPFEMRDLLRMASLTLAVLSIDIASGCATESSSAEGFPADELDGVLDCVDDSSWSLQGSIDPDGEGFAGDELALADALAPYLDAHDLRGPIQVKEGVASLTNGSGEVVIASVTEASPGNWILSSILGCEPFALR